MWFSSAPALTHYSTQRTISVCLLAVTGEMASWISSITEALSSLEISEMHLSHVQMSHPSNCWWHVKILNVKTISSFSLIPIKWYLSLPVLLAVNNNTMQGVTHDVCLVLWCFVSNTAMATYGQLVMLSRQRLHLHLVTDKHNTMYV